MQTTTQKPYFYPFRDTDERVKLAVWQKGRIVPNWDPALWRMDMCGSWMLYTAHGQEGPLGWEIDHIYPRSRGGLSVIDNLQPLWWRNNRRKGDTYPWFCL